MLIIQTVYPNISRFVKSMIDEVDNQQYFFHDLIGVKTGFKTKLNDSEFYKLKFGWVWIDQTKPKPSGTTILITEFTDRNGYYFIKHKDI